MESTFSAPPTPQKTSLVAASVLDQILRSSDESSEANLLPASLPKVHPLLLNSVPSNPSPLPRLFLACVLTPYRGITYADAKQKQHLAVEAVIREGLKLGVQNHYLDGIPLLFASSRLLQERITQWGSGAGPFADLPERVALGILLRDKNLHNANTGSVWSSSVLFSLVQELVDSWNASEDKLHGK